MGLLITLVVACLALIVEPFISFWLAYFGGWITSLVVGDVLAEALNTLFNVSWFTKDILPICAGALGWIGSFFKASRVSVKKE